MEERVYKPDSVRNKYHIHSVVIISLEPGLLQASSNLPGNVDRADLSPGHENPGCVPLFGFAPGDACRATCVTTGAVGSYPTFSPLPDKEPLP